MYTKYARGGHAGTRHGRDEALVGRAPAASEAVGAVDVVPGGGDVDPEAYIQDI